MARKTNKTDHVLNLLSSGKKSGREENDAPPVDLRKKAPEPASDDPFETHLPEPKMTSEEEEAELPEPRMSRQDEASELPEPRISHREEDSALPEPHMSEDVSFGERPAVVAVAANTPSVSVVHASSGEDSIAEAVKDSLEAEFNEYLKGKEELEGKLDEKLGEITAQQEQVIEWEPLKPKEPTEINVFELLGGDEDAGSIEPAEVTESETVPELIETPEAEVVEDAEPEPAEIAGPEQNEEIMPTAEAEPETVEAAEEMVESVEAQEPITEAVQKKEEPMQQSNNEEKNYIMVNVMEHLVRDQVPTYVRQFGHCDCDRCIEDTVALTLTHLPSKYVVVNKAAVSPLLNFYEKKYAGQLIVEITKATMIVNESPHH